MQEPDSILSLYCFASALQWEIEKLIAEAQWDDPDPSTGPPRRLFVPAPVCSKVLQWIHSSKLTCHPGINRTLSFLKGRFSWPTISQDNTAFVLPAPPPPEIRPLIRLHLVFYILCPFHVVLGLTLLWTYWTAPPLRGIHLYSPLWTVFLRLCLCSPVKITFCLIVARFGR